MMERNLFEQGLDMSERSPDPGYLRFLIICYVLTIAITFMIVMRNIHVEQSIISMSREVRPGSQSDEHLLSHFDQDIEQIVSLN